MVSLTTIMKKVLTYVCMKPLSHPTPAAFNESIVDVFQSKSDVIDEARVVCSLSNNCLILSPSNRGEGTIIRRAAFCPFKNFTPEQVGKLSPRTNQRGINVAVAVLLESRDNFVLITKRSMKMRTFPGIWVPPGGHIDFGESLEEAGLRELHEETGVTVKPLKIHEAKILGLWESAFPPMLSSDVLPSRHHIVTYISMKDERNAVEINASLKLEEAEVEQSAWLCCHLVAEIVKSDSQFEIHNINFLPQVCHRHYCSLNSSLDNFKALGASIYEGKTIADDITVAPMLNSYEHDRERVSTGTKFALKLWLESKS